MSDAALAIVFLVGALVSVGSSWVLVSRLERVGARLGLSEALLGVLAALAADAPEITAAVTALAGHQARIGAGVVIGSNVFNLAALLGLAAIVAGRIALHRRVIVMEGVVALWVAAVCLVVVIGLVPPAAGLAVVLCVLVPYLALLGARRDHLRRLRLPQAWVSWLMSAIVEEELELSAAIHPRRGRARDAILAAIAVLVVVGASVAMEQAASKLGAHHAVPDIVIGGLILAGVTSLPNAVAAVYLARRGRGAATLSTAMNSNALNVAAGLLLPGAIVGLGASSAAATLVAAWYVGLTAFALGCAYTGGGLRRGHGALIICAYLAFAGLILTNAYASPTAIQIAATAIPVGLGIVVSAMMLRNGRRGNGHSAPESATTYSPRLGQAPESGLSERSDPGRLDTAARTNGRTPAVRPLARERSLVAGWSVNRIWYAALLISSIIAAVDAVLGRRVILIGLLIAGPCCALLTGRWARTAVAGAWAVALAVLLGLPDGIWGSYTHLAFLAAVVIVTVVSTTSAAVIERSRQQ